MNLDIQLFQFFNSWAGKNPAADAVWVFLARYLPYGAVLGLGGLLIFKFQKFKYLLLAFASALLARFVLVEAVRLIYFRPRPYVSAAAVQLFSKGNEAAFPSGHAAFFFALAMGAYFYRKNLGVWLFVLAGLIAAGRVISGVHYPGDILAGAVAGLLMAFGLQALNRKSASVKKMIDLARRFW